jgi:hypothetical protein
LEADRGRGGFVRKLAIWRKRKERRTTSDERPKGKKERRPSNESERTKNDLGRRKERKIKVMQKNDKYPSKKEVLF